MRNAPVIENIEKSRKLPCIPNAMDRIGNSLIILNENIHSRLIVVNVPMLLICDPNENDSKLGSQCSELQARAVHTLSGITSAITMNGSVKTPIDASRMTKEKLAIGTQLNDSISRPIVFA